jgi:hypothetical protein
MESTTFSRRSVLGIGAAAALGLAAGQLGNATKSEAAAIPRPTGTGYVRYEDLYRAGDDLQMVINKVTGNRVLTFPEGVFTIPSNFRYGYKDGVRLGNRSGGAGCRGLVGSGRGTIFRMVSSNQPKWPSGASPYMLIHAIASSADPMITVQLRNFQIQGTNLGHEYHGLRLSRANGVVDNVYINGITGYPGLPPNETGSINLYQCTSVRITNTEVDGRRAGVRVSASPVMVNNSSGITFQDCYFHHSYCGGGGIAWFESRDSTVTRVRSEYIGSGTGKLSSYCFNHEQSTRITYNSPVMICDRATTGGSLHMSLNSDSARGGTDSVLTVNNPKWDATTVGGGKFVVETWNIATQAQKSSPRVYGSTGAPLPFTWLHPA